jgi:hypothetical protein
MLFAMAAPVERSAVAAATPSTIWKSCFEEMKWEIWDEDVLEIVNIKGGRCNEGATFTFHMKENDRMAPCKLIKVKENETLTFAGTLFAGMLGFEGKILLTQQEDGKTKVDYSFELSRLLGALVMMINPKPVVDGTETGLANIVRLSEEAQAKQ